MEAKQAVASRVGKKSRSVRARVVRCGCTLEQRMAPNWHGTFGTPCPNPRAEEDLGIVSYWHKNPLKRLWYRVRKRLFGRVKHV